MSVCIILHKFFTGVYDTSHNVRMESDSMNFGRENRAWKAFAFNMTMSRQQILQVSQLTCTSLLTSVASWHMVLSLLNMPMEFSVAKIASSLYLKMAMANRNSTLLPS